MTALTCGEATVRLLEAYGIDTVFGIPGVHNLELYRGLAGTRIRHVSPRHEQGAGFMADGYARASGRPAACFLTTGPGVTNAATAIAQAYADSVPMLVVASVNARHALGLGRGLLHELPEQRELAAGLTGAAYRVLVPEMLPDVMANAFAGLAAGRPRPVHVEIPTDVLTLPADDIPLYGRILPVRPGPDLRAAAAAADLLAEARRTAIIAGGGAIDAARQLLDLADRLGAPVVLTGNARGLLPPDHPLLADNGLSTAEGRSALSEAEIVLAVGTELGETDFDFFALGPLALTVPLIRIDIDPRQPAAQPATRIAIVSDAALALDAILSALAGRKIAPRDTDWASSIVVRLGSLATRNTAPLDGLYDRVLRTLRERLDAPIIVGDSTKPVYRGVLTYRAPRPRSWFSSSSGYGTLGYALPAATGAKCAAPDRPVVALIGDGGAQFTLPELIAAREAGAGIIVVVWNNGGYGEIRDFMDAAGVERVGVDVGAPDFVSAARAMGVVAHRVETMSDLADRLSAHSDEDGPVLIEAGPWLRS